MKTVVLGGASGLIGQALAQEYLANNDQVWQLKRPSSEKSSQENRAIIPWRPSAGELDKKALEGADIVIHLGGANIAEGRWTSSRKALLRSSRIDSTALIAKTLAAMETPPEVFICASAIGFYGDRGQEQVDETSKSGEGFLADLCVDWEQASEPAVKAGIRVVHARFGIVLDYKEGALGKMAMPFELGLGGVVGSGTQMMSWISKDDAVRALRFCAEEKTISGPVNLVHPQAVSNREFTKTLGRVVSRPTLMTVPKFAAKMLMGEMAEYLLFDSCHVVPQVLQKHGFTFKHQDLEAALRFLRAESKGKAN